MRPPRCGGIRFVPFQFACHRLLETLQHCYVASHRDHMQFSLVIALMEPLKHVGKQNVNIICETTTSDRPIFQNKCRNPKGIHQCVWCPLKMFWVCLRVQIVILDIIMGSCVKFFIYENILEQVLKFLTHTYIYIYTYTHMIHIYILIYIERERSYI